MDCRAAGAVRVVPYRVRHQRGHPWIMLRRLQKRQPAGARALLRAARTGTASPGAAAPIPWCSAMRAAATGTRILAASRCSGCRQEAQGRGMPGVLPGRYEPGALRRGARQRTPGCGLQAGRSAGASNPLLRQGLSACPPGWVNPARPAPTSLAREEPARFRPHSGPFLSDHLCFLPKCPPPFPTFCHSVFDSDFAGRLWCRLAPSTLQDIRKSCHFVHFRIQKNGRVPRGGGRVRSVPKGAHLSIFLIFGFACRDVGRVLWCVSACGCGSQSCENYYGISGYMIAFLLLAGGFSKFQAEFALHCETNLDGSCSSSSPPLPVLGLGACGSAPTPPRTLSLTLTETPIVQRTRMAACCPTVSLSCGDLALPLFGVCQGPPPT